MARAADQTISLARLSATRGLFSSATSAIAIVWGYAVFVIDNSALATGLIDAAYTLSFAAASTWLSIRNHRLAARTAVVVGGLIAASVLAVTGLVTGLRDYLWLLLLAVVIGLVTGTNYPAWYSLLRQAGGGDQLVRRIGSYESLRVVAVLGGTVSAGLIAHIMGVEPTGLLIAGAFAAGSFLALSIPRLAKRDHEVPQQARTPGVPDADVARRVRVLYGLLAVIQLILAPIVAVTPVLAVESVGGGAAHVGILAALYGAGGALQFLVTKAARGAAVHVPVSAVLVLMLASATTAVVVDNFFSAGLLMASFGFGVASIGTLINAEIQSSAPESERDRRVATFALVFSLPMAVGSGLWGLGADFVTVPALAVIASGLTAALAALVFLTQWRSQHRHATSGD